MGASKEARDEAIKRAAEIVRNDRTGLMSRRTSSTPRATFAQGDSVIAYGLYEGIVKSGLLAHNAYDVEALVLKRGNKRRSRVRMTVHHSYLEPR